MFSRQYCRRIARRQIAGGAAQGFDASSQMTAPSLHHRITEMLILVAAAAAAAAGSGGSGGVHTRWNAIKNDLSARLLVNASALSVHPSGRRAADVERLQA